MSVKKSETALAESDWKKNYVESNICLAVPFLIYVFAFSYVPLVDGFIPCLITKLTEISGFWQHGFCRTR